MFYLLASAIMTLFIGSAFIDIALIQTISYFLIFAIVFFANLALKEYSLYFILSCIFEGVVVGFLLVTPIFFGFLILLKGSLINEYSKFYLLILSWFIGLGINYILSPIVKKLSS